MVDPRPALRPILAGVRLLIWIGLAGGLILLAGVQNRAQQQAGIRPTPPLQEQIVPFQGVTVDLAHLSPSQRRADLARLRAAGFGWVRQRLDWQHLEPQPGRFDWAVTDDLMAAFVENEMIPVLVLDGSPDWARADQDRGGADNPFAPPVQPADFARFAAAVAARYGPHVTFYQLWDEPNVAPHWGNRLIDPIAYARLLAAASPALRTADPDAVILLAALAPTVDRGHMAIDEVYFLERLYAAGAAPHFDAVAVQPFGFGLPPAAPPDPGALNFRRAELVRRAMLAAGDAATPVWAVRAGWNQRMFSPWGTVSETNQIRFAQEATALAWQEWPWLAALGWAIDRPAVPITDPLWGFALVDNPGTDTPTPVSAALSAAIPTGPRPHPSPLPGFGWRWFFLFAASLVTIWRAWAASRLLPWAAWGKDWMRHPLWLRAGAWAILAGVYFLATWPPLIILCWLLAALGFLAEARQGARLGLGLTVVLLPFHIYHKELALVTGVLTVPPAYAALLATLPALLQTFREGATKFWNMTDLVAPSRKVVATDWLALAWLGLGILGALQGWPWMAYAVGFTQTVLVPLLLYAGMRLLAMDVRHQRMILGAAVLGATLAAGVGIYSWAGGDGTVVDGVRRLTGPTFSPNHMALYLERCLFLAIGFAAVPGRARWIWTGAGLIIVAALALTASRGAWLLGIPAGVIVLWVLGVRSGPNRLGEGVNRLLIWGGLVGLSGGAGILWLWGERLTNSATLIGRLYVWRGSLALWLDHLWLGVGPGRFFWRYPAYLLPQVANEPNLLHPHNLWLEAATGGGILGLVWLGAALVIGVRLLRRQDNPTTPTQRWLRAAVTAGLVAGLAHAQVDAFSALPDLAAWNWMALGILAWRGSDGVTESTSRPG